MDDKNFINNSRGKACNKIKAIVLFRLLFVGIVPIVFFLPESNRGDTFQFFQTLAVFLMYNILVSINIVRQNSSGKKVSNSISFIDCIFTGIFAAQSGGAGSEVYLIYFFIIAFHGTYNDRKTGLICLFSILTYSIACIVACDSAIEVLNIKRLIMRNILLILASLGISNINHEVKKYNELHKKEFRLARTDKLTGLANRHYFDQKLGEELEYADRTGKPLNILLFDLDNFKKFNDTYGHTWGDKLLTLFSDIIKQNIRNSDIPVRYGGEEFLLILRDLDIDTAKSVADRIRRQLEKQRIYIGNGDSRRKVTVSCGVAQYPKHARLIKEAIDCADKALYRAKEEGKNIVVTYDEMNSIQIDIDNYINRI